MQMQARKERVGRNTEKNETVFGWRGRSTGTPLKEAIKGRKLNMEYSGGVQLCSVVAQSFDPFCNHLQSLFLNWNRHFRCPGILKHHHHCELPFHRKPRKFLLI